MDPVTRLDMQLRAAGLPIAGVSLDPSRITYAPDATPAQRAVGDALLAAFDPSDAAQQTWEAQRVKARAKAKLMAMDDEDLIATRNALRVIMASIVETRNKLNEVIAQLNAKGPPVPIAPLVNRTWPQVLAAAQGQIDAETDPGQ